MQVQSHTVSSQNRTSQTDKSDTSCTKLPELEKSTLYLRNGVALRCMHFCPSCSGSTRSVLVHQLGQHALPSGHGKGHGASKIVLPTSELHLPESGMRQQVLREQPPLQNRWVAARRSEILCIGAMQGGAPHRNVVSTCCSPAWAPLKDLRQPAPGAQPRSRRRPNRRPQSRRRHRRQRCCGGRCQGRGLR